LIYQGKELFMIIPASHPQTPAIISETISPIQNLLNLLFRLYH
jgi:hypothetical protein